MTMNQHQAARLLKFKKQQTDRFARLDKARRIAPGCSDSLALEILKAQERRAVAMAKRK